jgi:hypothetical protein
MAREQGIGVRGQSTGDEKGGHQTGHSGLDRKCALTFALEAKFEIEAKISFRLEAKKSLISHDSLRWETPKI